MNNTTLKEISKALHISISTVSRALNNHPDISEKTKRRVIELSKTLDYEPNASAIQLRTSKSNAFGLVVPFISNFFYHSFISAMEEECRRINHSLIILQSGNDPNTEATNLKLCRQNRVSGLFACISTQVNMDAFTKMEKLDIPVVFFDKVPESTGFNKVCVADEGAAVLAATSLIDKQRTKIVAVMGSSGLLMTRKRLAAFTAAIDERAEVLVCYAENTQQAEALVTEALLNAPDSIFCMSDEVLTGAMKAIQKSGLKIPTDIAVIAISNGFIPKLYHPEITYVETSGYKLGQLAFSRMMECLSGSSFVQELTTEALLVHGGSL